MNFKRIACMVLSLMLALSLAACRSASSGTGNSDKDIDTLAAELRADFPSPCQGYDAVLSNVQMDMLTFDVYLSSMAVAYDNMSAEEFCKYFYELNNSNDAYITDTAKGVDSVATMQSDPILKTFSTELTAYQAAYTAWGASFTNIAAKAENAPSYQDLKAEAKDIINTFSNLLYGKDMVS